MAVSVRDAFGFTVGGAAPLDHLNSPHIRVDKF
jgi:hypothetical protein